MVSSNLHAVTVRLDVLRHIVIELAAALPPDRAAGVVTAVGNRLTERLCDMEIDEPTDDAMVSDLAPILAAMRHSHARRNRPSSVHQWPGRRSTGPAPVNSASYSR